jgi:hypothetical protein
VVFDDSDQTFQGCVDTGIQIQAEYGVFSPLGFQPLQGQTGEELLFSLQIGAQGRAEKGFSKPTGPGEEVDLSFLDEAVEKISFVYIKVLIFPNRNKILNPDGEFPPVHEDSVRPESLYIKYRINDSRNTSSFYSGAASLIFSTSRLIWHNGVWNMNSEE